MPKSRYTASALEAPQNALSHSGGTVPTVSLTEESAKLKRAPPLYGRRPSAPCLCRRHTLSPPSSPTRGEESVRRSIVDAKRYTTSTVDQGIPPTHVDDLLLSGVSGRNISTPNSLSETSPSAPDYSYFYPCASNYTLAVNTTAVECRSHHPSEPLSPLHEASSVVHPELPSTMGDTTRSPSPAPSPPTGALAYPATIAAPKSQRHGQLLLATQSPPQSPFANQRVEPFGAPKPVATPRESITVLDFDEWVTTTAADVRPAGSTSQTDSLVSSAASSVPSTPQNAPRSGLRPPSRVAVSRTSSRSAGHSRHNSNTQVSPSLLPTAALNHRRSSVSFAPELERNAKPDDAGFDQGPVSGAIAQSEPSTPYGNFPPGSSHRRLREKSMLRSVASFFGSGLRRLSEGISGPNPEQLGTPNGSLSGGGYGLSNSRRRLRTGEHHTRSAATSPAMSSKLSTATNSPTPGRTSRSAGGTASHSPPTALRTSRSARTSPVLADLVEGDGESQDYPLRRHKTTEALGSAASFSVSTMRSLLGSSAKSLSKSPSFLKSTIHPSGDRSPSKSSSTVSTVQGPLPSTHPLSNMLALPALSLQGRRPDSDVVLTTVMARHLQPVLPVRLRLASTWKLLYSTSQHGISISTLFRQVQKKGPCILAIRDTEDHVFGAFISEPLQPNPSYYGSGECFLWKAIAEPPSPMVTGETVEPISAEDQNLVCEDESLAGLTNVRVFKWSEANEYFVLTEPDFLAFGGGDGKFGLWLDSEFEQGSSAYCPTYRNEPLCLSSTADSALGIKSHTTGEWRSNSSPPVSASFVQGATTATARHGDGGDVVSSSLCLSHDKPGTATNQPPVSPRRIKSYPLPDPTAFPKEVRFDCLHVEVWGIVP
ncbi:oxidation resistance protein 1 [Dispira parvispora]|uniref:Oxidation resistance protein 1 n=1 Tax=Dispira parvispora TaxID=1520584 RepID=A0A9W8E300_9FUNG|nr:oxidation resistance protein 1 [Dispira parvispora]